MNKIIQFKGIVDMNIITEVLDLLLLRFEKEQNSDFWRQVWLWLSINPNESAAEVLKYCVWESTTMFLLERGVGYEDLIMYKKTFDTVYEQTYESKVWGLYEKCIQKVVIIK